MKSNLLKLKQYQISDANLLKSVGGQRTEYQNCIIRAIMADPDYDDNQNDWQDICSNLYGSPTLQG
jgi:hypothetical protein